MKKEELLKIGLDEENAKKVADASAEELKGYIPKVRFDEVNNDKKKLELDLRERDGQLETLKNSTGDIEGMKKQIETLQADNKAKDEKYAADMKQVKIDSAIDSALTSAKARNAKAVKALLEIDPSKVEILADGSLKGLDVAEQLEKLKGDESSKFLFEATNTQKPKIKGAAPGETGKEEPNGKVDTSKMSYEEIAAYMEQNPDTEI